MQRRQGFLQRGVQISADADGRAQQELRVLGVETAVGGTSHGCSGVRDREYIREHIIISFNFGACLSTLGTWRRTPTRMCLQEPQCTVGCYTGLFHPVEVSCTQRKAGSKYKRLQPQLHMKTILSCRGGHNFFCST